MDHNIINDYIHFVDQPVPLGTGNAILCCKDYLVSTDNNIKKVLILSGDVPFITPGTLNDLLSCNDAANILVANITNPTGYGRIILKDNKFIKIIEDKEFTPQEQIIVDAYEEMEGKDIISASEMSSARAAIQKDQEGLQAESDNPNVIDQILAKKEEIVKKKLSLENEYRAQKDGCQSVESIEYRIKEEE